VAGIFVVSGINVMLLFLIYKAIRELFLNGAIATEIASEKVASANKYQRNGELLINHVSGIAHAFDNVIVSFVGNEYSQCPELSYTNW
jgi:hypothetical protein